MHILMAIMHVFELGMLIIATIKATPIGLLVSH